MPVRALFCISIEKTRGLCDLSSPLGFSEKNGLQDTPAVPYCQYLVLPSAEPCHRVDRSRFVHLVSDDGQQFASASGGWESFM